MTAAVKASSPEDIKQFGNDTNSHPRPLISVTSLSSSRDQKENWANMMVVWGLWWPKTV